MLVDLPAIPQRIQLKRYRTSASAFVLYDVGSRAMVHSANCGISLTLGKGGMSATSDKWKSRSRLRFNSAISEHLERL